MNIPSERIENFAVPEKDETRSPMKAIWLDVEGKRLLASDGRMAMRVVVEVGDDDVSGLVPVEAFELARKELKSIVRINGKESIPDPWLKVICNPDAVFIENLLTNVTHFVPRRKLVGDEKFPNIDAVFPVLNGEPSVTLNMFYLATVAKSMDAPSSGLSLWVQGNKKCVAMATDAGKAMVVLMPMSTGVEYAEVNKRAKPTTTKHAKDVVSAVVDSAKEALSEDAHISKAIADLVAAIAESSSGIDSMTLSVEGGPSVTITKDDAKKIRGRAKKQGSAN